MKMQLLTASTRRFFDRVMLMKSSASDTQI
jgi:hypothetical protein